MDNYHFSSTSWLCRRYMYVCCCKVFWTLKKCWTPLKKKLPLLKKINVSKIKSIHSVSSRAVYLSWERYMYGWWKWCRWGVQNKESLRCLWNASSRLENNTYPTKLKVRIFKSWRLQYGCSTWKVSRSLRNKLRLYINHSLSWIYGIYMY